MKRRTPQQRRRSNRRLVKMYSRRNIPFLKLYMQTFYEANRSSQGRQSMHDRMKIYASTQQLIDNNWPYTVN